MSIAADFYEMDSLSGDQIGLLARNAAWLVESDKIESVEYTIYYFQDHSKLRLGNNGYMGMEEMP